MSYKTMDDVPVIDWFGLYADSWGTIISSQSYAHPAKFSFGLASRIYSYAIERGWAIPGKTVVIDPFAGVGCGAFGAMQNGLDWVGIELEQNFFDIANGCDCIGVSPADYPRLFTRAKKLAYKDRHLCPQCLDELGKVTETNDKAAKKWNDRIAPLRAKFQAARTRLNSYKAASVKEYYSRKGLGKPSRLAMKREPMFAQPLPFPEQHKPAARQHGLFEITKPDTLAYERNSGRIPVRPAHHYRGNIERWAELTGGRARIIKGDSRFLSSLLGVANLRVSSPPFGGVLGSGGNGHTGVIPPHDSTGYVFTEYGTSPAQLGAMSLGSPPFSPPGNHPTGQGQGVRDDYKNGKRKADLPETTYGQSEGQLATLSLGSPTFPTLGSDDPDKRGGLLTSDPRRNGDKNLTATWGDEVGQMGSLVVGSPPYSEGCQHTGGKDTNPDKIEGGKNGAYGVESYGSTPGQLGSLSVSSPSWAGNSGGQTEAARNGIDAGIFARHQGGMKGGTGASEGNLDSLPMGEVVSLGSPPFMAETGRNPNYANNGSEPSFHLNRPSIGKNNSIMSQPDYGSTPHQLANEPPLTFWSASETIIRELHSVLQPESVSIWVCKRFIQAGKVVNFSQQWADLCQHCGFELIEWVRAWQVEDVATATTLEGKSSTVTKGNVSFFRNLVNKRHKENGRDELVITNEDILVLRRI